MSCCIANATIKELNGFASHSDTNLPACEQKPADGEPVVKKFLKVS